MSEATQIYKSNLKERIKSESPEGRPANPDFGSRSFGVVLIFIAFFMMLGATVLALFIQPLAAIVVGVLALVVFLVNPEVWAALLRGKERDAIERRQRR